MDTARIEKRLLEIQQEHEGLSAQLQEAQRAVSDISARRLQLEGAFNELQALIQPTEGENLVMQEQVIGQPLEPLE